MLQMLFVAGPKARNWSGRLTSFHVAGMKCSFAAESHALASRTALLSSDLTILLLVKGHIDHMSLVHCARCQTLSMLGLRTIASLPAWMIQLTEAEATGLADWALRVQQQAARKTWRSRVEENTTGGAAKVHQFILEPTGFQAARLNAVDEHRSCAQRGQPYDRRTLRAQRTAGRRMTGRSSIGHRRMRCAASPVSSFRAITGLAYDSVPPRALNELPDQGIVALIDLILIVSSASQRLREASGPSGSSVPSCACNASVGASRRLCTDRIVFVEFSVTAHGLGICGGRQLAGIGTQFDVTAR